MISLSSFHMPVDVKCLTREQGRGGGRDTVFIMLLSTNTSSHRSAFEGLAFKFASQANINNACNIMLCILRAEKC